MFKRRSFFLLLVASVVALSASVQAESILIDFSALDKRFATPPNWNVIGSSALGYSLGLKDSDGRNTSTTLRITDDLLDGGPHSPSNSWPPKDLPSWLDGTVLDDVFFLDGVGDGGVNPTGQITLTGLDDRLTYILELVSTRNNSVNNYVADYKAQGLYTTNSQGFDAYDDGYLTHHTMLWTDLAPVNGQIVLDVVATTGNYAILNAMRLTAVPEPSSLGLLAAAGLAGGLVRFRRRPAAIISP